MKLFPDIITVKSDVQFTVLNFILRNLFFYLFYNLVRKINTSGLNPDKNSAIQINMILHNLVSQLFYGYI